MILALMVLAGIGFAVLSMRPSASASTRACRQLATPGLTLQEGRAIVDAALARGVPLADLRKQCQHLVDGYGASPTTAPAP